MTYRVWFLDGSARLVTGANSPVDARRVTETASEERAREISPAYQQARVTDPERAHALMSDWLGGSVITRVEQLA